MTALSPDHDEVQASVPANFRDLGGIPTSAGHLRAGLVFRSDDLATVPTAEADRLVSEHGLAHVIDLRSPAEAAITGRGPLGALPVSYHHVPLGIAAPHTHPTRANTTRLAAASRPSLPPIPDAPPESPRDLAVFYADVAEYSAPSITLALAVIAATAEPVVFHCAAGKDRTGILAALLLSVLGASPESITADYAATDAAMPRVMARLAHLEPPDGEAILPSDNMLLHHAPAAAMAEFLGVMTDRHGNILAPLRQAGLTSDTERRLRTRLVG